MHQLKNIVFFFYFRREFESVSPQVSDLLLYGKYRTVCITTKAFDGKDSKGKPNDYFCRVFAPWIGITEDSVTGMVQAVSSDSSRMTIYAVLNYSSCAGLAPGCLWLFPIMACSRGSRS